MAAIQRFEDVMAWQAGRVLCVKVYALCRAGGLTRDWGLKDQMTRAAGSVMHNIAEGFDSGSDAEFVRFLGYARRSCTEVQSELYVALDQGYIDQARFEEVYGLATEARSAIAGLTNYLRKSIAVT